MLTFLRSLIALAYLASATLAQAGFVVNSYSFASAAPVSVSFVACTSDGTAQTTYTFTAHNVGTADPNRSTVVLVYGDDATVFGVNSVTVGGDSAAEVVDEGGAGLVDTAIYILANPVGTSENIVVTWSEAVARASVCVYSVLNLQSLTPVATRTDFQTSSALSTMSINTTAGGVAFLATNNRNNDGADTLVGLTSDSGVVSNGTWTLDAASALTATTETPRVITSDWGGGGDASFAAASFR